MINLIIGAVVMGGLLLLIMSSKKRERKVSWWQWILTFIGFIYLTFVLEVLVGFLEEGAGRAALVNGVILGIIAVVWGVLLGRFVFSRSHKS